MRSLLSPTLALFATATLLGCYDTYAIPPTELSQLCALGQPVTPPPQPGVSPPPPEPSNTVALTATDGTQVYVSPQTGVVFHLRQSGDVGGHFKSFALDGNTLEGTTNEGERVRLPLADVTGAEISVYNGSRSESAAIVIGVIVTVAPLILFVAILLPLAAHPPGGLLLAF